MEKLRFRRYASLHGSEDTVLSYNVCSSLRAIGLIVCVFAVKLQILSLRVYNTPAEERVLKEHAMTDTIAIADEAAARLAFGLMRSAYLDLARMLRSIEDEPACELLEAVENRLHYRIGTPSLDPSAEVPRSKAIAAASQRVREVLREAVEG